MLLTTEAGVKEMIQSLGLLCLVSLLLALGSLVFLLKIIPNTESLSFPYFLDFEMQQIDDLLQGVYDLPMKAYPENRKL